MAVTRRRRRIEETFARTRGEGRAAFIAFLMAGDPDLEASQLLVEAAVAGGADIVELGVPFSDPIADGPTNQAAAMRALASGTRLADVLSLARNVRRRVAQTPLVLFSYFNPIHAFGIERFARRAAAAEIDGVLCVDLPPEEGTELRIALDRYGIDSVYLLAPTSPPSRIALTARASSGFVYYVSRAGVTGEQTKLTASLRREVRAVKSRVSLPVAVGFGISNPEQVAAVGDLADGVVVGSALVRMVEEARPGDDLVGRMRDKVGVLSAALAGGEKG